MRREPGKRITAAVIPEGRSPIRDRNILRSVLFCDPGSRFAWPGRRSPCRICGYVLGVMFVLACVIGPTSSDASERRHGLSAFGDLKYPADFKHFDYVNPDAPKGGRLATMPTSSINTFNEFNGFILRGDPAEGVELLFDSLMVRAQDEPDAVYGLIAESAEVADDRMSVTFYLRPDARFRDGTPVTAADVAFTLETLKQKGHPRYQLSLRDVLNATVIDPATVKYQFKGENVRDLPTLVASLPVFSKAYYTANDFLKESLDPPLGSGPYEISDFRQGTYITYKRRKDYWAANLPVNRGRYNFDDIRFEYYRDRAVGLEAFKAKAYDLREEFTSKSWATEYDVPAVRSGKIIKLTLPDGRPSGAQGMFINLRREKFSDPRVRKALDYAFDFEWTNKSLFYGLYTRTASYFENSDLKAQGLPTADELTLLEPFRDKLPPEVFGEPYTPPVTDGSGRYRPSMRTASQLLGRGRMALAGWHSQERQGRDPGNRVPDRRSCHGAHHRPLFRKALGPGGQGCAPPRRPGPRAGAAKALRI